MSMPTLAYGPAALLVAFGLAACGTGAPAGTVMPAAPESPSASGTSPNATESPDVSPTETADQPAGSIEDADLIGTFGGDAQLEGGCAWVDGQDGKRYEVIYPEGWSVHFEPLHLIDPDAEVRAEEGDRIGLDGSVGDDLVSICQVGTIFEAREVFTER